MSRLLGCSAAGRMGWDVVEHPQTQTRCAMWLFALLLGGFGVTVWAYLSDADLLWIWFAFAWPTGLWWLFRLAEERAGTKGQHRADPQSPARSAETAALPFEDDSASTQQSRSAASTCSELLRLPVSEPAVHSVSPAGQMPGAESRVATPQRNSSSVAVSLVASTAPAVVPAVLPAVVSAVVPAVAKGFKSSGSSVRQHESHDYARNAGRAGYLYAARNQLHMPGLFKLGQTVGPPARRVAALNDELGSGLSLGSFELVHAEQTDDAYGCEQALFAALAHRRLVETKEFFLLDLEAVPRLLQAASIHRSASELSAIIAAATADYGANESAIEQYRKGATFIAGIPDRPSDQHGWVLALRNECHAADIVRLMHVETDPYRAVAVVNDVQARDTARVGRYALVGCWATLDAHATVQKALSLLGPQRRIQRTHFVRATPDEISSALRSSMLEVPDQPCAPFPSTLTHSTGKLKEKRPVSPPPTPQRREPTNQHRPLPPLHQKTGPRLMNFCPNRECNTPVHVAGAEEDVGEIRCSGCRRRVGYAISGGELEVWEASK